MFEALLVVALFASISSQTRRIRPYLVKHLQSLCQRESCWSLDSPVFAALQCHTHPMSTGPHLQRGGLHRQLLENAYQGAARAHALQLVGPHCVERKGKEKKGLRLLAAIQREAKYYTGLPRSFIVYAVLQPGSSVLPQSNLMPRLCIFVQTCYGSKNGLCMLACNHTMSR